jgi:predicted kinase
MRIVLTRGLPASGKSTWTNSYLKKNPDYRNVNRDDLRNMVFGVPYKFSKEREKAVTAAQEDLAKMYLDQGKSVIVSDTNLNPKAVNRWKDIGAAYKAPVDFQDFTDVSPQECIKRDLKRANSVGSEVIMRMYNSYLKPEMRQYVPDQELPGAVLYDLDGTLALMDGKRSPYDWSKVGVDSVDPHVKEALLMYREKGYKIILLSGRDGICKGDTMVWLRDNEIPYDEFFIRPEGNSENDAIIKERIFWEDIAPKYNVGLSFDDRNRVVDMWRSIGLKCFQCADGDF